MTTENSSRGEPASAQCAVALQCLDRVRRTARRIPAARREQGRKSDLVATNEEDEQRAHVGNLYGRRVVWLHERVGIGGSRQRRQTVGETGELSSQPSDDFLQLLEGGAICRRPGVNYDVERRRSGKEQDSTELPQSPLEAIPLDGGSAVLGNDEADPGVLETRKGSDSPNVQMFGSESLPCSCDAA